MKPGAPHTGKDDRFPGQATAPASPDAAPRSRSTTRLVVLLACAALAFAGFFALGTWQVRRLHWKLDLIARVNQRVHAAPVPAPGPDQWPRINAEADEYKRVRLTGTFLYKLSTRVQASTELGAGFWLLTPLRRPDGSVVLVNRGFVPPGWQPADQAPVTEGRQSVTVTGLLRMSEPGGAFLRSNDPAANRWYSRDVQAIAVARGLSSVAPYFVDEEAANATTGTGASRYPVGGLTVIAFHNSHLVYAFTWYGLALMVAGACVWVMREERRLRRPGADASADGIDRGTEDGRQD